MARKQLPRFDFEDRAMIRKLNEPEETETTEQGCLMMKLELRGQRVQNQDEVIVKYPGCSFLAPTSRESTEKPEKTERFFSVPSVLFCSTRPRNQSPESRSDS
jgi:hypothetical protein